MSRTYRRKNAQWEKQREIVRVHRWASYSEAYGHIVDPTETLKEVETVKNRFHKDGRWCMTTPSWWIRAMMTRPQRQQVRKLSNVVLHLVDLEDA